MTKGKLNTNSSFLINKPDSSRSLDTSNHQQTKITWDNKQLRGPKKEKTI